MREFGPYVQKSSSRKRQPGHLGLHKKNRPGREGIRRPGLGKAKMAYWMIDVYLTMPGFTWASKNGFGPGFPGIIVW
jgi:hypothetical protein